MINNYRKQRVLTRKLLDVTAVIHYYIKRLKVYEKYPIVNEVLNSLEVTRNNLIKLLREERKKCQLIGKN